MKKMFNNKSLGQTSGSILFIVIAIVVVIIIIVLIISLFNKNTSSSLEESEESEESKEPEPIYEVIVADVKFKLKESKNRGNVLKGSESKNPQWQQDLTTSDKFIEVTITVENLGKENITRGSWDLNDLFDKEDRHFFYVQSAHPWISEESQCGELLKPGFTPTPCTKIYEVANISTGLKVKVSAKSSTSGSEEAFIDLVF